MKKLAYNQEKRTLKAVVEWPKNYFGTKTWEYEVEFDPDFKNLIDGSIDQYDDNGDLFDCYPLCDPDIPDQNFKLNIENPDFANAMKSTYENGCSIKFNPKFFDEIYDPKTNTEFIENLSTTVSRTMKFGLKISSLESRKLLRNSSSPVVSVQMF